ncbi:uncharacterized protein LOC132639331 [Lycium barbarum]|uniref:uncharacterized protein LOC132639331 n=1 Tax=Lycium barbarum TaxID=112863 RepID=UPI00293EB710|nr:uncharacterized protein LOC132639331 [Lycium barbarum]
MEEDFKAVWYKRSIEIDEQVMWLEKWTPEFKPDEDSPIVLVWVLLPGLPFHLHTWNYVKQVVAPIGTPLTMDAATENRTRPSMAKVRVEVNLTKTKLNSIFVGTEDENCPRKGFYQKIEYENVPKFCTHCKILGHSILQCSRVEKKKVEELVNKENRKIMQNNKVQVEESVDDDNVVENNQQEMQNATEKQGLDKPQETTDTRMEQSIVEANKPKNYTEAKNGSVLKEKLDRIKRKRKKKASKEEEQD